MVEFTAEPVIDTLPEVAVADDSAIAKQLGVVEEKAAGEGDAPEKEEVGTATGGSDQESDGGGGGVDVPVVEAGQTAPEEVPGEVPAEGATGETTSEPVVVLVEIQVPPSTEEPTTTPPTGQADPDPAGTSDPLVDMPPSEIADLPKEPELEPESEIEPVAVASPAPPSPSVPTAADSVPDRARSGEPDGVPAETTPAGEALAGEVSAGEEALPVTSAPPEFDPME